MEISNAGKVAIGKQEELWTFLITGPKDATLVLIGKPVPSSERLVVSPAENPASNTVAVRVGSLEPHEFFNVRLIVVNASDASTPSFDPSTSLAGLPKPILAHDSPEARATLRVAPWLLTVFFLGLMFSIWITEGPRVSAINKAAGKYRVRPEAVPKFSKRVRAGYWLVKDELVPRGKNELPFEDFVAQLQKEAPDLFATDTDTSDTEYPPIGVRDVLRWLLFSLICAIYMP
jgi:hypothetical protein